MIAIAFTIGDVHSDILWPWDNCAFTSTRLKEETDWRWAIAVYEQP